MSEFIRTLAGVSFSGGIFILAAVLVRSGVKHRLPKHFLVLLWAAVLVHFIVLLGLPSPTSIYNYVSFRSPIPALETAAPAVSLSPAAEASPAAVPAQPTAAYAVPAGAPGSADVGVAWLEIAFVVWAIGAAALLLVFLVGYWRTVRRFTDAILLRNNPVVDAWRRRHATPIRVFVSDRTATPLAFGLFRPRIVLPHSLDLTDEASVEGILEHEYIHCRHCHNAMKAVVYLALAIHWFNPLMWLYWLLFNHDIELACDESVIAALGTGRRAAYAHSLVAVASHAFVPFPLASAFSARSLKERIVDIMGYRRTTTPLVLAEVALILLLFALFGTTAASSPGTPATAQHQYGNNSPAAAFVQPDLSAASAVANALALSGGGDLIKMELEEDDDGMEYEFVIVSDGEVYSIEMLGDVVGDYKRHPVKREWSGVDFSRFIGVEQACAIALTDYPGAALEKCELKRKRGGFTYVIKMEWRGRDHEVEVDAQSGAVVDDNRSRRR
ncbi:MAG: M56 family metallopeptidase [Planctomycetaceae bacterium]|nr:M56 family metallopeptidase [Planctomycetaceae bacterium]